MNLLQKPLFASLDTISSNEHKATYKPVTSTRIDTIALKRENPAIAEQYSKTIISNRFIFN